MIPLDQTMFGNGENGGSTGNCWQACVASLLDLPLATVPHFALKESWWQDTKDFVIETTGLGFGCFKPNFPMTDEGYYVIGTGISDRGLRHAVILDGVTGELVHDPHPSRSGLSDLADEIFGFTETKKE